jgi:CubicO group peptidase (beta-lactamase class C family)
MHLNMLGLCLVLNLLSSSLWANSITEQLEHELKPMVPIGAGGIVGLLKAGKELTFIPFGQLSVTNPTPVNQESLTLVASTSKMFVGLLAVRLAELGILSLDTEFSSVLNQKHFEIFEDQELAQHITLRQMLSHTSGLQYDADCEHQSRAGQDLETILDGMVKEVQNNPAKKIKFTNHPHDKIYSYSNQIWIATIFIEDAYNRYLQSKDRKTHHLSYAELLKHELLKPMAMNRTGFHQSTEDPFANDSNKIQAFVEQRADNSAYSYELYTLDPIHRAVGGMWTTAEDLMKLAASLTPNVLITKTGSVLISKPYIEELIQIQGTNGQVGLGVYHEQDRIGKGGSLSSYGSNFEVDLATGNAVVSLINFRPAVPTAFDSRALLALDAMGSIPRVVHTLPGELKEELRELKKHYQVWTMADYDTIFMSKFGFIGVLPVKNGLMMNWNGSTLVAGKVADNRFMLFDDEYRDGIQIVFGKGPYTHLPYLFFENGNDNSQAFKAINKEEVIPKDSSPALKLLKTIHGLNGISYQGTRPDGAGAIKLKWNEDLKQITAQSEGNEVPIFVTKVVSNEAGLITEVWFMGNHFTVPDKLTKLIRKDNNWVLAIAIFDNPDINVEYLMPNLD